MTAAGCLTVLIGPVVAVFAYPRLNWLFWVACAAGLLLAALIAYDRRWGKDPAPRQLADEIEKILSGKEEGWDIDNFESTYLRDPRLRELKKRCYAIGLPETWAGRSDEEKARLRGIIDELRNLKLE